MSEDWFSSDNDRWTRRQIGTIYVLLLIIGFLIGLAL